MQRGISSFVITRPRPRDRGIELLEELFHRLDSTMAGV
jgi:hypothetical protein